MLRLETVHVCKRTMSAAEEKDNRAVMRDTDSIQTYKKTVKIDEIMQHTITIHKQIIKTNKQHGGPKC